MTDQGDDPAHEALLGLPAAAGGGVLLASDPVRALSHLAAAWRRSLSVRVAAVTGTNGKTTTKDLLAALLAGAGPTWATAGNYNNDLGLPLTLLGLRPEHRFAVVEMGASAVGDIARLAPPAAPDVGVITNASEAHLAEFGSLDDIVQGKGELLEALPPDGTAVLNADSPGFRRWRDRARCPVVSFGRQAGDHRYGWQTAAAAGESAQIELDGRTWPVPLPGEHNGANLVAAILAARALGVDDAVFASALAGFRGSAHRSTLLDMGGRTVLDDCYNANPRSMTAAAKLLVDLPGPGRNLAVLGRMAELGSRSGDLHRQTGRELVETGLDVVVAVGPETADLVDGFASGGGESHYFPTLEAAAEWLADHVAAGERLLVKGSRSAGMEEILPLLQERWLRKES